MGTSSIDVMQSQDITQLESDVSQLNTKLNALIVEFNKCSDDTSVNETKISALIDDVKDINDKISDGYSASGGTAGGATTDSILTRMQKLDEDFTSIEIKFKTHVEGAYDGSGIHSVTYTTGRTQGGSSNTPGELYALADDLDVTADGEGADTSVNADPTTNMGLSYSTAATKVITIGAKGEVRAKRLARQTLNRLRK